jgi:diaminohydroxyphosphoribosylaminopyrimidine deaminase/5-amino-6-(5-phosphoribosylamino)uracil reductase
MALALAKKGLGTVSPNPMVGAILVKDNAIVGKGYHRKAGSPHAEVGAIESAGGNASGSTLYVNLEPCVHYGRTPPCADRIVAAGIRRVVVAMLDPNPLVNGKGVEMLRKAGIDVRVGMLDDEARRLNEVFIGSMEKKRPFVTMKAAVSLDGKIATKTCDSKWISNEESRRQANLLRCINDGVLVGINTVISDNPFSCRGSRIRKGSLSGSYSTPNLGSARCDVVKTSEKYRTWVFTNEDSRTDKETKLTALGVEVIRVPKDDNGRHRCGMSARNSTAGR